MTTIWLDAHLSPGLAAWISRTFDGVEVRSVRALGLQDAEDEVIFRAARGAGAIVMTKDADFVRMIEAWGVPPHVIWIRSGNTSNARMRAVLSRTLRPALDLLASGEPLVEIGDVPS